jgi:hypothetical protein
MSIPIEKYIDLNSVDKFLIGTGIIVICMALAIRK